MSTCLRLRAGLAALILLLGATGLKAQLLDTFSAFTGGGTLFFGAWSASGDPFAGDTTPAASLVQAAGAFQFDRTTALDTDFAERWFSAPLDLSGSDRLRLSLQLLPDNTAPSVTIVLFDQALESASATFALTDFTVGAFTARDIVWTPFGTFDSADVVGFRISGNLPFGTEIFSVSMDGLRATGPTFTPVPEPAFFGLAGVPTLLIALRLRARREAIRPAAGSAG